MRDLRRHLALAATLSFGLVSATLSATAATPPSEGAVVPSSDRTVDAQAKWHLDTSFGTDGFTVVAPEPGGDPWRWGRDVAIQPDGKIVVASGTEEHRVAIFRLLPDGALDPTFGDGGFVVWTGRGARPEQIAIRLQTVGTETKILALDEQGSPRLRMWRFNADGSTDDAHDADPDVVFGKRGQVNFKPDEVKFAYQQTFSVGPDGSILVSTYNYYRVSRGSVLVRFDRDGAPDTGFAPNGIHPMPSGLTLAAATTMSGGHLRIVATGTVPTARSWKFTAYTTDGALDPTFGDDGTVKVTPPDSPKNCDSDRTTRSLHSLSSGGVVAVGRPCRGHHDEVESAVRLTADGDLDVGFGDGGWASPFGPEVKSPVLYRDALRTDLGVAWGGEPISSRGGLSVAGVLPDGTPDPRFGDDGLLKIMLPAEPAYDYHRFGGLTFDDEGRIVVTATTWVTIDEQRFSSAFVFRLTTT